jgi:ribosomal protein S18 acetylase RimI-like enzyme
VTASLRPMREDQLPAFVAQLQVWYASDIEQNGGLSAEQARTKAAQDVASSFPDGRVQAGHSVYVVEDGDEPVGALWIAERDAYGRRIAWVYDVEIDEEHRGRGLGRAAMLLCEEEARRRGIDRVELNVFGGNEVARNLYRSLGYSETSVWMGKDL